MRLPSIKEYKNRQSRVISSFEGINRTCSAGGGEFSDSLNLSSMEYPALSPSVLPKLLESTGEIQGVCRGEKWVWISDGQLYYGGEVVETPLLTEGEKSLVCVGSRIYIFPDKLCFDCTDRTFSNMEHSATASSGVVIITPCLKSNPSAYIVRSDTRPEIDSPASFEGCFWLDSSSIPPKLKKYVFSENVSDFVEVTPDCTRIVVSDLEGNTDRCFYEGFNTGDSITLSGSQQMESALSDLGLLSTFMIYEKGSVQGSDYIILDTTVSSDKAVLLNTAAEDAVFTAKRRVPHLDMAVLCQNRIFGCNISENRIYASGKNLFCSWYGSRSSTDSPMQLEAGTPSPFTALAVLSDVPYFFKESCVHKIIGSTQSVVRCEGVQRGCAKTLQVHSGAFYYKSFGKVMRLASGVASSVSDKLGHLDCTDACAALFDGRYYLCLHKQEGGYITYVYDMARDIWHKEDTALFTDSLEWDKSTLLFFDKGVYSLSAGENGDNSREGVCWYAESTDLIRSEEGKKALSRIVIRASVGERAHLNVYVMYDGDGNYVFAGSAKQGYSSIPLLLRRCDRIKIRLEGRGYVKLISVSEFFTPCSSV